MNSRYGLGLTYVTSISLLLVLAVALRILDPAPIARLRLIGFDYLQNLHQRQFNPDLPVRIVDIDEASLQEIGQWPWPRRRLADLVHALREKGAAVVAFDFLFAEPERRLTDELAPLLAGDERDSDILARLSLLPTGDDQFSQALDLQPTVLGVVGVADRISGSSEAKAAFAFTGDDPLLFVPSFAGALTSADVIHKSAKGAGALNWVPDYDQIVRRVPLIVNFGGRLQPSLAVEALRIAQGASTIIVRSSNSSHDFAFGSQSGVTRIKAGAFEVPTDPGGQLWLHFTKHQKERYISAKDILSRQVPNDLIEGRIVLVGSSAAGLLDLRATPLDSAMAGVEVHAQAIEQILSGEHVRRPDYFAGLEIVSLVFLSIVLAIVLRISGASLGAFVGFVSVASVIGASWYLFRFEGFLLDSTFPVSAITATYLYGTAFSYFVTERERNQVRQAFGHYMAAPLVKKLLEDPKRLKLGGETRELTLLFSDVRAFTSIAETYKSDPEGLTRLMNQLLTPLSNAIIEHQGVIDKYMGDAIMAFWNAPIDDPQHPQRACQAALAMVESLKVVNQQRRNEAEENRTEFRPIILGIGLSTGDAVVGNMGSDMRFDYSALGDVVNLASRLESLSSQYGVQILAGGSTIDRVASSVASIELDIVQVKGRETAETVHAILGDHSRTLDEGFISLRDAMADFTSFYRNQQWQKAAEQINVIRSLDHNGELETTLAVFNSRIVAFRTDPPGRDWAGIWRMTEK